MPEEFYDRDFPNLRRLGYERTSEPAYYNCISFAVGDERRRWWPGEYHPIWSLDYWPPGAPTDETLEAFAVALGTVRFVRCGPNDGGRLEKGFQRIALYGLSEAAIRHAAKQMPNGKWRSKLGPHEDIEHALDGLVGPCYGSVIAFFKRPSEEFRDVAEPPGLSTGWLSRSVRSIRSFLTRLFDRRRR
jgi:hypothetical protein